MSDLRERLEEAFERNGWERRAEQWVIEVPDAAEVAREVFATWLRERAAKQREIGNLSSVISHGQRCESAAVRLERLADDISPTHDTEAS
jgi:hypothetical protein